MPSCSENIDKLNTKKMLQSIETLEDGSIIGFWLIEETEDELIALLDNRSDMLDAMASFSSKC